MKNLAGMMAALAFIFVMACQEPMVDELDWRSAPENSPSMTMDVYEDGDLYTVNVYELSEKAAEAALENNTNIAPIFEFEEGGFTAVIPTAPGDQGYNPLWQEVDVEFVGIEPYQITSADDLYAAQDSGDVELIYTDEVYRCAVINKK